MGSKDRTGSDGEIVSIARYPCARLRHPLCVGVSLTSLTLPTPEHDPGSSPFSGLLICVHPHPTLFYLDAYLTKLSFDEKGLLCLQVARKPTPAPYKAEKPPRRLLVSQLWRNDQSFKIENQNTKIQFLVICISINEKVESLSANRLITN